MKFLGLLLANLGRHKRRTVLTIASVALALFLFASLRSVITTLSAASQWGSTRRLVSTNATGFVFPVPISYANRIRAIQGVDGVTWANWFGGRYGDGKRFFASFAVDAESYLELYPEIEVSPEHFEAFMRDRSGALIGERLIDVFGWQIGQTVTLEGTIYPGDWPFTIRGTYRPLDPVINDDALMFHFAYLDERAERKGDVGWYIVRVSDPNRAAEVGKRIDDMFRNSSAPTKTGTEQAFNASFATMWGNIGLLMNTIGTAVVFAILMVTANAMMMSARERTREVAILKAIGFSDTRLFMLVMVESALITLTGAVIGLGGAKLLYGTADFTAGGFLPGFDVTGSTMLIGVGIALLLMLASGIVPAMRAARLPVVTAMRNVG